MTHKDRSCARSGIMGNLFGYEPSNLVDFEPGHTAARSSPMMNGRRLLPTTRRAPPVNIEKIRGETLFAFGRGEGRRR